MSKPLVYMDSCCFIDMVAFDTGNHIPDNRKKLIWHYKQLLLASRKKDITVITSFLTLSECLYVRDEKRNPILTDEVKRLYNSILLSGRELGGVYSVMPDHFIIKKSRSLNWDDGIVLDPFDSLHIATAIEKCCSEFITTDENSINKKGKDENKTNIELLNDLGLEVITADKTKVLPEKYHQKDML